jgi:CHAD domain-containing protein
LPVIAPAVTIDAAMTVREALAATVESCLAHYHANALVLQQSHNAEGVHQMRVALRRLRALVSACAVALAPDARAFLAEEMRWLQQQFGPARDWDVFIAETLEPMLHRLPNDRDLPIVRKAAETRREEGYRQAREAIGDPHHVRVLLRIGGWLATGDWIRTDGDIRLEEFAAERLQERLRKMRKFGKALDLPIAELHQLRIAAKKMRYVAEFFRPIYPKKASKLFFAALKDLQDDLGSINDAVVTERLMDDLEPRVARRIGLIRAARARSLLTGWQAQRVEHDLERFRRVWDRFRACDPFWPKPPRRPDPASGDDSADTGTSSDVAPGMAGEAGASEATAV